MMSSLTKETEEMINETNLNENLLGVELFLNELYAQVLHELRVDKAPYWFNNDEVARIQQLNQNYMEKKDIAEMVEACFRKPQEGETVKAINGSQMLKIIQSKYTSLVINHSVKCHLSTALKELGYDSKDCHHVTHYFAIPLKEA